MTWPRLRYDEVPWISSAAMRRADSAAGDCGIEALQLMEAAGIQVARFADAWMAGARGRTVGVLAGGGNNGGDALVAARHLLQRGARVRVWLLGALDRLGPLTQRHLATAQRLGIPVDDAAEGLGAGPFDLIIDGLLGTGVRLPLRGPAVQVLQALNRMARPVLAVDVPSGLDADTGLGQETCAQAAATLTLGLPKSGTRGVRPVGRLFLADIGLPPVVFGPLEDAARSTYTRGELLELVGE